MILPNAIQSSASAGVPQAASASSKVSKMRSPSSLTTLNSTIAGSVINFNENDEHARAKYITYLKWVESHLRFRVIDLFLPARDFAGSVPNQRRKTSLGIQPLSADRGNLSFHASPFRRCR